MRVQLRKNVSVIVWGMHTLPCTGNLVVIDGNLNQQSYIDLMDGTLLVSVEQMLRDQQQLFVF